MAQADTPLGREISTLQAAGRLVSDDTLAQVILARTSQPDCATGYILDGFPRTRKQAEMLEDLARKQGKEVVLVRVVVSDEALMKRLTGRRNCRCCGEIYNIYFRPPRQEGVCDLDGSPLAQRSDDNAGAVGTRLASYEESTAPLIDFYRASGRLVEIDGELPVEKVFQKVITIIDESRGRDVTGS
jgi:adenylate kinase